MFPTRPNSTLANSKYFDSKASTISTKAIIRRLNSTILLTVNLGKLPINSITNLSFPIDDRTTHASSHGLGSFTYPMSRIMSQNPVYVTKSLIKRSQHPHFINQLHQTTQSCHEFHHSQMGEIYSERRWDRH